MSLRDRVAIHTGLDPRTGVLQSVCAVCALVVAGCSASTGPELAEVFAAELAVDSSTPANAASQLGPGVYLVEVRERGIDLRAAVEAGAVHGDLEDAVQRHGLHAEVVRLQAAAEIRVTVRSADHRDKRGSALVRISRWPYGPSAPADEIEQGFAEFGRAGRETALGIPDAWTRAADALRKSSAHFTSAGVLARRAQAEYSLGSLEYVLRAQWQPAIRAAEAAGDAYQSVDDPVGHHRAAILRSAADLEVASELSSDAQRMEQAALLTLADKRLGAAAEYLGKHGERLDQAHAVNVRGQISLVLGDDGQAAQYFREANEIARELQDPITLGNTFSNLALISSRRGEIARAASAYQALVPLLDRDRDPDRYAAIVGNYGMCLIALGEFDRALELHTQALEVFSARGADGDRARQLNALGGLYIRIGEFDRALATLRAAIELNRRVGNSSGRAQALRLAGNAAAALGDSSTALAYLRESLTLDANPENVARTRILVARQARVLGDLARADSELEQALTSANDLTRAWALAERAALHRAQGSNAAALADLRAADKLFATLGLDFDRIDTHAAMAQAMLAMGDLDGASIAADSAIATEQRIRIKSANPEWRARFLAASYAPYEARIAVDLAASRRGDELAAWRAFRTAEAVRARSLADQLASSGTRDEAIDDPAGDALRARLTAEQIRLENRILRQDVDDDATNELRRSIAETRALIDAHSLRLTSHRSGPAAVASLPESLEAVKAGIPPETAVLAFFVGDEASHAWLLSREGLEHRQLAGRAQLERVAQAAIVAQRTATGSARPDGARAATRALLGSLLKGTHSKRLLLIPDGPLNGIPFGALPTGETGSEILIDRFVLGYAPSMSLAMRKPPRPAAQPSRVVVVSDPIYARDDSRIRLASGGDQSPFRGSVPEPARQFTRLPYSSVEARAVTRAFAPGQTIDISGFEATPARVLQLKSEKIAVLHFATHALARQDAPEQSALYLSEYGADGTPLADSQLTADQIARSGLHADLVVLSGCATGDGGAVRGEGVLGLTYAFLANGSRSVIASLWPIQDASTARLMKEFYAAYRTTGRAADALREAQLRMRDGTAWASFVVRANDFP